jgi:thymidylate synthase
MWGFSGINTFEWSVVQEMLAYWTGVSVGTATFFISSLHLYSRHEPRAPEMVRRFPNVTCYETGIRSVPFGTRLPDFDQALRDWFALEGLVREDPDRARAAVEVYPDSLLRHFLALLRIYAGARTWPRDVLSAELAALPETDLTLAAYEYFSRDARFAVAPDSAKHPRLARYWDMFCGEVSPLEFELPERLRAAISSLHSEKSAAYGDSWKRRGEVLGIVANIARKVDRLERALTLDVTTHDESLLDTAIDLLVYATKYVAFIADQDKNVARRVFGNSNSTPPFSDGTKGFDELLSRMDFRRALISDATVDDSIRDVLTSFAAVEACISATTDERAAHAGHLVETALAAVAAVVRASPSVVRSTILSRHPMQDSRYATE